MADANANNVFFNPKITTENISGQIMGESLGRLGEQISSAIQEGRRKKEEAQQKKQLVGLGMTEFGLSEEDSKAAVGSLSPEQAIKVIQMFSDRRQNKKEKEQQQDLLNQFIMSEVQGKPLEEQQRIASEVNILGPEKYSENKDKRADNQLAQDVFDDKKKKDKEDDANLLRFAESRVRNVKNPRKKERILSEINALGSNEYVKHENTKKDNKRSKKEPKELTNSTKVFLEAQDLQEIKKGTPDFIENAKTYGDSVINEVGMNTPEQAYLGELLIRSREAELVKKRDIERDKLRNDVDYNDRVGHDPKGGPSEHETITNPFYDPPGWESQMQQLDLNKETMRDYYKLPNLFPEALEQTAKNFQKEADENFKQEVKDLKKQATAAGRYLTDEQADEQARESFPEITDEQAMEAAIELSNSFFQKQPGMTQADPVDDNIPEGWKNYWDYMTEEEKAKIRTIR